MAGHRLADLIANKSVVVVLPCHNVGLTIASVVLGFQKSLPGADIVVFDNGSDDNTAQMARAAGARVFQEAGQNRTELVRRILAELDTDLTVLADGDGADDPARAPDLIARLIDTGCDMVVGAGCEEDRGLAAAAFDRLSRCLLGAERHDAISGYRVLTRRFARSFSRAPTTGDVATDMSIHARQLRLPVAEVAAGTAQIRDGWSPRRQIPSLPWRMLHSLVWQCRETRPASLAAAGFFATAIPGVILAGKAFDRFIETGAPTMAPETLPAAGLLAAAFAIAANGLAGGGVRRRRIEKARLAYLACPGFSIGRVGDDVKPVEASAVGPPRLPSDPGGEIHPGIRAA